MRLFVSHTATIGALANDNRCPGPGQVQSLQSDLVQTHVRPLPTYSPYSIISSTMLPASLVAAP